MVIFPKSKINLGLRITEKRDDGYHNIESIFYPVGLCDALEFVLNNNGEGIDDLSVTGLDPGGRLEDNLVLRAVKKLREIFIFPPLKIHLHKAIPAGAGLGGGSSDGACMLTTLNRFFGFPASADELKSLALGLGSDTPFFIENIPSFATGRGEYLEPFDPMLNGLYILLVNPGIAVSTKDAYTNCIPAKQAASLKEIVKRPVNEWKDLLINDFEKTVFKKFPYLGFIKSSLYRSGALYSSMTGSGSTIYGLFSEKPSVSESIKNNVIYEGII